MPKKRQRTDAERRLRQCERLGRLLRLLQLIMGKGRWDADALARELECSKRTIFRMLQTLSMAGVPWFFDENLRAYRVRPGFKFPDLSGGNDVETTTNAKELTPKVHEILRRGEELISALKDLCNLLKSATGEVERC